MIEELRAKMDIDAIWNSPSVVSQFEFITSNGPPSKSGPDDPSRKVIRTKAMRSYLHSRHSNARATNVRVAALQSGGKKAGMGRFRLEPELPKVDRSQDYKLDNESQERFDSLTPILQKDLGLVDILNVPLTPNVRQLLFHCQCSP